MQKGQERIDRNDIVGKRLGKLEVIEYDTRWYDMTRGGERLRHKYVCSCDCGVVKSIRRSCLLNDAVHSCGCGRGRKERHDGQ